MHSDYQLIDCGEGRRLESFAGLLCDRPAPMAFFPRKAGREVWAAAQLRYDGETRQWNGAAPADWALTLADEKAAAESNDSRSAVLVRLRLTLGLHGQVGVFPEQLPNWEWLVQTVRTALPARGRVRVLNAFAHTGAATLCAAAAGAEVCHLDAAGSAVASARRNAELSGLAASPVRWITDDVRKFLVREIKRKNYYDGIILDPPAFGRAGKIRWRLEDNLPELLELAAAVLTPSPLFFLLTCHPTGWKAEDLQKTAAQYFPAGAAVPAAELLIAGQYNRLPLGLSWRVRFNS